MDGLIRVLATVMVLFSVASVFALMVFADGSLTDGDQWIATLATPVSLVAAIVFYFKFSSIASRYQWLKRSPTAEEVEQGSNTLATQWNEGGNRRATKWMFLQVVLIAVTLAVSLVIFRPDDAGLKIYGVPRTIRVYLVLAGLLLLFGLRFGAFRLLLPGLWYSQSHWVRNRIIVFLLIALVAGGASAISSLF